MKDEIDGEFYLSRSKRRAAQEELDRDYSTKGLFRSGPRIKASANLLADQYEILVRRLMDGAKLQPHRHEAVDEILAALPLEFQTIKDELSDLVDGINGGKAARDAALRILERKRDEADAMIAEWIRTQPETGYGIGYGLNYGGNPRYRPNGIEDAKPAGGLVGEAVIMDEFSEPMLDAAANRDGIKSSSWTGQPSPAERIANVRALAPIAQTELEELIKRIELYRFNDPLSLDALDQLKRLHEVLGELIQAAEAERPLDQLLEAFGATRDKLYGLLKQGTNVVVAAPALTFGIVKLLSAICTVNVDTTLVAGVYASLLGTLAVKEAAAKK